MFPTTSVPFQIVMKYDDSETVISLRASARGATILLVMPNPYALSLYGLISTLVVALVIRLAKY